MQIIKCKHCGKTLLEFEGQGTIIKDCPRCKTRNTLNIYRSKEPQIANLRTFKDSIIKKGGI